MTHPILILRPQPGSKHSADFFTEAGYHVQCNPLFDIRPIWQKLDQPIPHSQHYDCILLGSANALRCAGTWREKLTTLPVFAVGEKSAAMAQQTGFTVAAWGNDGLQDLIPVAEEKGYQRALRLTGRNHVTLTPQKMTIENFYVYESAGLPLQPDIIKSLMKPHYIALHSARAARSFANLCSHNAVKKSQHILLCFSQKVADAAGALWAEKRIAKTPSDKAMLDLLS